MMLLLSWQCWLKSENNFMTSIIEERRVGKKKSSQSTEVSGWPIIKIQRNSGMLNVTKLRWGGGIRAVRGIGEEWRKRGEGGHKLGDQSWDGVWRDVTRARDSAYSVEPPISKPAHVGFYGTSCGLGAGSQRWLSLPGGRGAAGPRSGLTTLAHAGLCASTVSVSIALTY